MNKNKVFFIIIIMLLGLAVVPSEPVFSAVKNERTSLVAPAALATTGTMKIPVVEDAGVGNGTYATTNFGDEPETYVGTGDEGVWIAGRSYFKFDLVHIPAELSVEHATLNVFIWNDWGSSAGADEPIGAYYSDDNSWEEMTITWNNQPMFSPTPTDVIDSPASPDMFIPGNWYSWEITEDVKASLTKDKKLTEVLKFTEEVGTQNAFLYPISREGYKFNATYIEIEYSTPTTGGLTVDGIDSGTPLDYINSECPELGWTFTDPDYLDFQKDYHVEIWNNTYYNESLLWTATNGYTDSIYTSTPSSGNSHPFGQPDEFRIQMKYPATELDYSGVVDKLIFTAVEDVGDLVVENLEVSMVMVQDGTDLTNDLEVNLDGRTPTIVLSRDTYEVSISNNNWLEIDVEDTFFLYENLNLIIEIRLSNNTGDLIHLERTTTGGPGSVATNYGDAEAFTSTYEATRTYDLKIQFLTEPVFAEGISQNYIPFGADVGEPGRIQIKYNQSWVGREGYLDKIFFPVTEFADETVFENLTISLGETPILGPLSHDDMASNYGGQTPVVVLDESEYTVRSLGNVLVIDIDNTFYYSNTHDLLIDIQWDSLLSGHVGVRCDPSHTSSYRAVDTYWLGGHYIENNTAGYELYLDFINSENSVITDGCITLIEGERYYWRVRTCDSTGVWGDWTTANFKYETISEVPTISVLAPQSIEVDQEITVDVNATHSLGIYAAYIDYGGMNHSMTGSAGEYSYSWSPTTEGVIDFTIYVHSNGNTWASLSDDVNVTAASTTGPTGPGTGVDMTMIIIIVGAAAIVIIIIVIFTKKKK